MKHRTLKTAAALVIAGLCMLGAVRPASADAGGSRAATSRGATLGSGQPADVTGSADYLVAGCYIRAWLHGTITVVVWVGPGDTTLPNGGCAPDQFMLMVASEYRVGDPTDGAGSAGGTSAHSSNRIVCGTPVATPWGNGYIPHPMDTSQWGAWGCPLGEVHLSVPGDH